MYLRILLLSLGFRARDPFERAAQKAIRRFHLLVIDATLRRARRFVKRTLLSGCFWFFCIFLPIGFAFGAALATTLFALLLTAGLVGFLGAYFFGGQCRAENPRFVHDPSLSKEVAVLSKQAGVTALPVFLNTAWHGTNASIDWRFNKRILFSLVAAESPLIVRQGIFAHEFGHMLLPLDGMVTSRDDYSILYAREFAADAIGACLFRDARPVLLCLAELWRATPI